MRTGDRGWIELHELLTVILQPSEDGGLCSVLEARTNGPLGIQRVGSCPRTMVDPPSCETRDGDGVIKPVQSLLRTTRSISLSRYLAILASHRICSVVTSWWITVPLQELRPHFCLGST